MGIELTVLDFRPGAERASPARRSTRVPKKETAIDPRGELGCLFFVRVKIEHCGLNSQFIEAAFSGINPVSSPT